MKVYIPYRPTPDRVAPFEYVCGYVRGALGVEPEAVDSPCEIFSLAQARNRAVEIHKSRHGAAEPFVLLDADTIPDVAGTTAAVDAARPYSGVHTPYTEYRALDRPTTAEVLAGKPISMFGYTPIPVAVSGVWVSTWTSWRALGGQDRRMFGWGPEDYAMLAAHRSLFGRPFTTHPGVVYALDHDRENYDVTTHPQYRRNVAYYGEWQNAAIDGPAAVLRMARR